MAEFSNTQFQKFTSASRKPVTKALVWALLGMSAVFGVFLLLDSLGIVHLATLFQKPFDQRPLQSQKSAAPKVIAKVGNEHLYQNDLDFEIRAYPEESAIDKKKVLLDKMVKDSLILQGAAADGIIALDESVFNSPSKDYSKRMELVEKAKRAIEERKDSLSGTVVSIWFFNMNPAPIGYEKGKELAFAKISKLHDDVKNNRITIHQAGEQIKNDTTLSQADPFYKWNAIFDFQEGKNESITFDKSFDALLWKLQPGEVSDIYLAKDKDPQTGTIQDAVYLFGQVSRKVEEGHIASFDAWFSQKQKVYAVSYY